jgi:hypothetical protein
MKIIATIKRADGNETVGTMWQETAVFQDNQTIRDVFMWASERTYRTEAFDDSSFLDQKGTNIILSVGQDRR